MNAKWKPGETVDDYYTRLCVQFRACRVAACTGKLDQAGVLANNRLQMLTDRALTALDTIRDGPDK